MEVGNDARNLRCVTAILCSSFFFTRSRRDSLCSVKNIRTAALRFLIVYQCSVAEERNVVLQLIKFMIVFIRLAQLKEQKFIISVIFYIVLLQKLLS